MMRPVQPAQRDFSGLLLVIGSLSRHERLLQGNPAALARFLPYQEKDGGKITYLHAGRCAFARPLWRSLTLREFGDGTSHYLTIGLLAQGQYPRADDQANAEDGNRVRHLSEENDPPNDSESDISKVEGTYHVPSAAAVNSKKRLHRGFVPHGPPTLWGYMRDRAL